MITKAIHKCWLMIYTFYFFKELGSCTAASIPDAPWAVNSDRTVLSFSDALGGLVGCAQFDSSRTVNCYMNNGPGTGSWLKLDFFPPARLRCTTYNSNYNIMMDPDGWWLTGYTLNELNNHGRKLLGCQNQFQLRQLFWIFESWLYTNCIQYWYAFNWFTGEQKNFKKL